MDLSDALWALVAFFFWCMFFAVFFMVLADVFRRDDVSGWAKAGWILLFFVLPVIGLLVYVVARPRVTPQERGRALERYEEGRDTDYTTADELAKLVALRDSGELTPEEYQSLKSRTLH